MKTNQFYLILQIQVNIKALKMKLYIHKPVHGSQKTRALHLFKWVTTPDNVLRLMKAQVFGILAFKSKESPHTQPIIAPILYTSCAFSMNSLSVLQSSTQATQTQK
jgi:hypothetical protein